MKRVLRLLIAFSLIFVFSAAYTNNAGTPIEPIENNMIITIINKANFDFHGLEVRILNHSQGGLNADGSFIEKNEELRFEYLEEDFRFNGEEIEMEGTILTNQTVENNGERIPLNKKIPLKLLNNQEIVFELTGDSIDQAELIRKN